MFCSFPSLDLPASMVEEDLATIANMDIFVLRNICQTGKCTAEEILTGTL